jgi:hypothetical protein
MLSLIRAATNVDQAMTCYEKARPAKAIYPAIWRWPAVVDRRAITAFGLPFILYLLTLAPTIYNLDSAELTTAAATGGIVRATGYPLYLMLGYVWSWLPVGDIGYRMNLFSAFNGALTVALAERILRRWQVGPLATFGALGLLACSTYFWGLSLIAEVYTLHTALMAGLILALLRWADDPAPRRLALAAALVGLSLGHHAATVLLVPGCAWYVATTIPRRACSPRSLLPAAVALLAGVSVYLYLPLRQSAWPAFNYAGDYDAAGMFRPVDLHTAGGLWWLVSGRSFAGQMFAYRGAELWAEAERFGIHLWRAFFGIGIGPGVLGAIVLLRRDWRLGGMALLLFICSAGFYIDYRVVDKDTMFLPAYLIWALWIGLGYQWLLTLVRAMGDRMEQRWGGQLLQVTLIGAVLFAAAWNWRLVNLSSDWSSRTRGETILRQTAPGALVLGWWETTPLLQYLQLVEGQRPDIQVINRFLISPDDMRALIAREIAHRPIYIDSVTTDLLRTFDVRSAGVLYRLSPRPDSRAAWGAEAEHRDRAGPLGR